VTVLDSGEADSSKSEIRTLKGNATCCAPLVPTVLKLSEVPLTASRLLTFSALASPGVMEAGLNVH
jgi:hypothetical protein